MKTTSSHGEKCLGHHQCHPLQFWVNLGYQWMSWKYRGWWKSQHSSHHWAWWFFTRKSTSLKNDDPVTVTYVAKNRPKKTSQSLPILRLVTCGWKGTTTFSRLVLNQLTKKSVSNSPRPSKDVSEHARNPSQNQWYCWWFRIPANHLKCIKNLVNNGISTSNLN